MVSSPSLAPCRPRLVVLTSSTRPRRTNGATHTFRRPSSAAQTGGQSSAVYVPPHRNSNLPDVRYTRSQLLELFKTLHDNDELSEQSLAGLYVGGWEPHVTGNAAQNGWSRRDEQVKEQAPGVDACWEKDGNVYPAGLAPMDDEEKEVRESCRFPVATS